MQYSENPHKRTTSYKNLQPKILQIPSSKIRNVDPDWFSKETGNFLSRKEDNFSMHTEHDNVLLMNYHPKLSTHMTFIRTFLT